MGTYADAGITIVVMLPMLFILGRYTDIGPVQMYLCVKILDIVKMGISHLWLKKERWLNNLTVAHSVTEPANAS